MAVDHQRDVHLIGALGHGNDINPVFAERFKQLRRDPRMARHVIADHSNQGQVSADHQRLYLTRLDLPAELIFQYGFRFCRL